VFAIPASAMLSPATKLLDHSSREVAFRRRKALVAKPQ
jgi:hypothetical protein